MGEIISRNMISWLVLLINRFVESSWLSILFTSVMHGLTNIKFKRVHIGLETTFLACLCQNWSYHFYNNVLCFNYRGKFEFKAFIFPIKLYNIVKAKKESAMSHWLWSEFEGECQNDWIVFLCTNMPLVYDTSLLGRNVTFTGKQLPILQTSIARMDQAVKVIS